MPGTGIHGYTGTSANGLYNISNGIIQSSAPSTNANDIASYSNGIINGISNAVANASNQINYSMAQGVAQAAGTSPTDYGEYIRQILSNADANTAKSQAFAREQMDYQTKSDQAAMAWSAQEAQKNRAWQESLADTAHQREVRDLIAAGLNPILSANAGAYTGSGATGQGFSSSGAMGTVDNSANNAVGSLISSMISSAAQAQIAGLYVDAEKYAADLQYSSSRLATEASVMNNQNSTSAQKWIATQEMMNDLKKTEMQGEYGLANTALSNSGAMDRTVLQEAGETGRQQIHEAAETGRTKIHEKAESSRTNTKEEHADYRTEYSTDYGSGYHTLAPWKKIAEKGSEILEQYDRDSIKRFLAPSRGRSSSKIYDGYTSSLLKDIDWG